MKKRGFQYLGSITVYSYLQACGIIDDHDEECPCFARLNSAYPTAQNRQFLEKGVQYFGDK